MAVLPSYAATLADLAARMDPDGNLADIVNMLSQENEILDDALWVECNDGTSHKTTVRTGLPSAAWRLLNYGVPYGKSTTAQVRDGCGMLETYSKVDKDLVRLAGANAAAFRLSEAQAFLEGMSQQMATALFYGNASINPERFTGLAPRYSTINTANANNAVNVIDAAGTGSALTSIWFVTWGPTTLHGIYPKGSRAGLIHEDVTTDAPVFDPNGLPYQAYQDHYKWDCGLSLRDWRYVVRIANVDPSTLTGTNATSLLDVMTAAAYKFPTASSRLSPVQGVTRNSGQPLAMKRPVIYMNRSTALGLDFQAKKTPQLLLRYDEVDGQPRTTFRGVPIKICDALLNTESQVT